MVEHLFLYLSRDILRSSAFLFFQRLLLLYEGLLFQLFYGEKWAILDVFHGGGRRTRLRKISSLLEAISWHSTLRVIVPILVT